MNDDSDRHARWAWCLQRARDGDREALTDVVRELNPLLWHVARAQGLDAEDAVDVVQTTWLELLRALGDIRAPQALLVWLVVTTRRGAWRTRELRRRHNADGVETLALLADPAPGPAEQATASERDSTLMRNFVRLPGRCQQVLRLVAMVERADYDAVAEALDMPRGSIGPTRGRCLAKLRQMLVSDQTWSGT